MSEAEKPAPFARRIVVADGDLVARRLIAETFAASGCEVREFDRGDSLLEALEPSAPPALVIFAISLPDESGLTVLRKLRERGYRMPIVLVASCPSADELNDAFRFGANLVLGKPIKVDDSRRILSGFLA